MAGHPVRLRRLGIDSHQEAVLYMRRDSDICRAEGFYAQSRVLVAYAGRTLFVTLNQIVTDLLKEGEASLSESAWIQLGVSDGVEILVSHPPPLASLGHVRAKLYGNRLDDVAIRAVLVDISAGRYSDIHLAAFVSACSGDHLDDGEILSLTSAMVDTGERLQWDRTPIVDKHCVGGLPGNRTTPIVVAIAAACGLTMPKTSSRAITSPAGTADVMETLTRVDLDLAAMRRVIDREGGCLVWGGAVHLAPADDIFIRIERALDVDSEGQLVASVLSKKIAAGSTHLVLDMPVGPTAKVRGPQAADRLESLLLYTAKAFGLETRVLRSDGTQPVGRGIGPSLEARDVLAILRGESDAPADLRGRSLAIAAALLELGLVAAPGHGMSTAESCLGDGRAWRKFQAICDAQGGMRVPPVAAHTRPVNAERSGRVISIDNRRIARLAKLAGAPEDPAAGVEMHVAVGMQTVSGQPLYTVHADSPGALAYALEYAAVDHIMTIDHDA